MSIDAFSVGTQLLFSFIWCLFDDWEVFDMENRFLKGLYYFSLFSWIATVCLMILSLLFSFSRLWMVGSFLSGFVQVYLLCEHCNGTTWMFGDVYSPFDRFLRALSCVIYAAFFACLGSLFIAGGGPEMVAGISCLVSHGKVVAEDISEGLFLFLAVCENILFSFCFPLFATTPLLWRVHTLYTKDQ